MVQNCKGFPTDLTQTEYAFDKHFTKIRQRTIPAAIICILERHSTGN
jgi:hypothetical protein